jgi:pyruvate,water dikinase
VTVVPLADAIDEQSFGGKAVQLGAAIRAGLPVPHGLAVAADMVDDVACGGAVPALAGVSFPVAVRSSGVGEDSGGASFAGQHATRLNVPTPRDVADAVRALWESARKESALAYRRRLGLDGAPRISAVVQSLVAAEVAGVMFTRNPLDGGEDLVIEASWGLGEAVVSGRVIPDRFRVARSGQVLERCPGRKDVALEALPSGGTVERSIDGPAVAALSLGDEELTRLLALGLDAERVHGGPQDVEWAFAGGKLHLLQSRPVTVMGGRP